MKKRGLFLIALLAGTISFGAWCAQSLNPDKEKLIFGTLLAVLEQVHFKPQPIDDDFSQKAFERYLDDLDGTKWFFIQDEVDQLKTFQFQIDDQANSGSLAFFDLSVQLIDQAVDRSEAIYKELIVGTFDLDKKEELELDSEKKPFR